MIRLSLPSLALGVPLAVALAACNPKGPPRGPEETCVASCLKTATACQEEECWRGCNLILDRLAESEGDTIVACVASATAPAPASPCDDRTWARCAVRVGPHADGGPPAPPPPKDWDEDQE
ncbi:MAG TPA: hypothetical protein VHV30_01560 [Polyangiaceae bacterium]|nr:hypothetical protein [Polyangiaceae bacterium]